MEISKAQGDLAARLEGRANELKSEIALDKARGTDTREKSEELAKAARGAKKAQSDQIGTLGKAVRELKNAEDNDRNTSQEDGEETVNGVLYRKDGKLQDKNKEQQPEYQAKA